MESSHAATSRSSDRNIVQVFCLVVGATLVLVGLLGFLAEASFGTGDGIQGDELIVFEVNGWHNVVHILTGLLLLGTSGSPRTARTGALVFAVGYGLVTVIGLVDGEDVLGLFPVNPADNVLHILLTVAAVAALMAPERGATRSAAAR